MNIIVTGCSGHMSQIVCELIEQGVEGHTVAAKISRKCTENGVDNCYQSLSDYTGPADCLIDFTNHEAIGGIMEYCVSRNLPAVIATTGFTQDELQIIKDASEKIPVFQSANMSVGIAVLKKLAKQAAAMFPDADIEIVEKHHNRKLDAPSGTALLLADSIREVRTNANYVQGRSGHAKRAPEDIGIHAIRMGNEVGTHEVMMSNGKETITLIHEAENRALFAQGALKAASFLEGKEPGYYTMDDLVG